MRPSEPKSENGLALYAYQRQLMRHILSPEPLQIRPMRKAPGGLCLYAEPITESTTEEFLTFCRTLSRRTEKQSPGQSKQSD